MEKVWLKRYPPNVPVDINLDQYRSLAEVIDRTEIKKAIVTESTNSP